MLIAVRSVLIAVRFVLIAIGSVVIAVHSGLIAVRCWARIITASFSVFIAKAKKIKGKRPILFFGYFVQFAKSRAKLIWLINRSLK